MDAVPAWKWLLAVAMVAGSAFCSGTETALTALGDVRARQVRERGGRRGQLLGLWVDHPERVLSTLLIGNTLVNMGAGALAASLGVDLVDWGVLSPATAVALAAAGMTARHPLPRRDRPQDAGQAPPGPGLAGGHPAGARALLPALAGLQGRQLGHQPAARRGWAPGTEARPSPARRSST